MRADFAGVAGRRVFTAPPGIYRSRLSAPNTSVKPDGSMLMIHMLNPGSDDVLKQVQAVFAGTDYS